MQLVICVDLLDHLEKMARMGIRVLMAKEVSQDNLEKTVRMACLGLWDRLEKEARLEDPVQMVQTVQWDPLDLQEEMVRMEHLDAPDQPGHPGHLDQPGHPDHPDQRDLLDLPDQQQSPHKHPLPPQHLYVLQPISSVLQLLLRVHLHQNGLVQGINPTFRL
jgi:hypothetical protein